jgi:hypothetical protein
MPATPYQGRGARQSALLAWRAGALIMRVPTKLSIWTGTSCCKGSDMSAAAAAKWREISLKGSGRHAWPISCLKICRAHRVARSVTIRLARGWSV